MRTDEIIKEISNCLFKNEFMLLRKSSVRSEDRQKRIKWNLQQTPCMRITEMIKI